MIIDGKETVSLNKMPSELVMFMYNNPFTNCPCCKGHGVHVQTDLVPNFGLMIQSRICDLCNGTGIAQYLCAN